jgi:exodeoxyribonuclease V gamma subunit
LVGRLVESVERRTEEMDRLARWRQPVRVLVPNLTTGDYLELAVADHVHDDYAEAAVGYEFETLQDFLTERLEAAAPDEDGASFELLDRHDLKTLLVDVLREIEASPSDTASVLDPVVEYLRADEGDGGHRPPLTGDDADFARRTRRYQLAARLGALFEEYGFSRPEWLKAWSRGESVEALEGEETGRVPEWEAELWRRVDERRRATEPERLRFDEAFDRVGDELAVSLADELRDETLHVFGFESFGDTFLDILGDLSESEALDVDVYVYSPGGESFVEESAKPETGEAFIDEDADNPLEDECHRALSQWGRLGAESLWQIDETFDESVDDEWFDEQNGSETAETWLEALQTSIRSGEDVDELVPDTDIPEDDSLRIVRAPNLRREVEIVANHVWHAVRNDDELYFSDVAIAIPEARHERYRAHVEAVFDQFHGLPYSAEHLPLAGNSPVRDAAEALLELPVEPFDREQLLSLATHPNVEGRFEEVETERWEEWVEELNILYGADRDDQKRDDEHYLDADLYNWDQGLKRLAFGATRDVGDEPGEARIEVDGDEYLPEDVEPSAWDEASSMATLIQSLIEDARWLEGHEATLEEWGEICSEMIDTYLVPNDDAGADYRTDQRDIARLRTTLEELGERPSIGEVPFRVAQLQAFDRLERLTDATSSGGTEGVVVTTPDRVRGVPFEHTFVLGLGEGEYPRTDARSDIDLRLDARQVGDVRASEQDAYHFLEMLQSTGERLTLSWIGRDPTSGDERPASSLIEDVKRTLPDDVRGEELDEEIVDDHPLHRYARRGGYFEDLPSEGDGDTEGGSNDLERNLHPEAFREAQMDALRGFVETPGGAARGREIWTGEAFLEAQRRLRRGRGGSKAPSVRLNEPEAYDPREGRLEPRPPERGQLPNTIRIRQLAKFLKSPLQAKAKYMLGMYEDDEDATGERVEPMELGHLEEAIIGRKMGRLELIEGDLDDEKHELNEKFDRAARDQFSPGDVPREIFGETAKRNLVEDMEKAKDKLDELEHDELTEFQQLELSVDPGTDALSALELSVPSQILERSLDVRIVGESSLAYDPPDVHTAFVFLNNSSAKNKYFLKGYLFHLALSSHPDKQSDVERKMDVLADEDRESRTFAPLSSHEAREHLCTLVRELLVATSFEFFPIDVLDDIEEETCPEKLWRDAKKKDSQYKGGIETGYGALESYLSYPPPDKPLETVRRRFGSFFQSDEDES